MTSAHSGILFVDKPQGLTSHDVVARVRRLAGTRKVGHAGTLDPLATGLLVIGVQHATRLLTHLVGLDKEYLATIRLGATTPTDDAGSDIAARAEPEAIGSVTDDALAASVGRLTGPIEQVPSTVSAIKVGGRRAYDLARAGESVELRARPVVVSEFEIRDVRRGEFLDVDVRVACSSGTYIRALARDLGIQLGVGGHLTALRRTRVGPFTVDGAATLEDLEVDRDLVAPEIVASELFPVEVLDADGERDLMNGKRIRVSGPDGSPVAAIGPQGRLVGLIARSDGVARVLTNFPTPTVEA